MKLFSIKNENAPVSYKMILHTFRAFKQDGISDAAAAAATAEYLGVPTSEIVDNLTLLTSYNIANESIDDEIEKLNRLVHEVKAVSENFIIPGTGVMVEAGDILRVYKSEESKKSEEDEEDSEDKDSDEDSIS